MTMRADEEDIDDGDPPYSAYMDKVYFVRCGDFVKIGKSANPERRVADFGTGNPFEMKIMRVTWGYERQLQHHFAAQHHRLEWYRFEGPLREWLEWEPPV